MRYSVFALLLAFSVQASEMLESDNIWKAVEKAQALQEKYGPNKVLFASDLDNTLLKTKQDLSSEPWFNWQSEILKEEGNRERVACDMPDLLHIFSIAISLSQTSPVQGDQAKAILRMQELGVATIAVTARGEQVSSATFRQLKSNDIDFSKTSLAGNGFPQTHIPFPEARPVLYQRGVLFSDGQNKGTLLKTLLQKTHADNIRGIVFWDNDKKNTQRVYDAFEGTNIEVYAIRASRQDADIERFNKSDKTKVTEDYLVLRKLLDSTYQYPRPCKLPVDGSR